MQHVADQRTAEEEEAGIVYVWELPVRLTHWINVIAIGVLSATGMYIATPFLPGGAFTMRWAQAIHLLTGCIFASSVAFRLYFSLIGNRWASYRAFFPVFTAEGRASMKRTLLYYLFLRRRLPGGVGHNALAASTYTLVLALFLLEIVTGFAMLTFAWGGGWSVAFGWIFHLASPQTVHLVHYMGMWLLLAFVVHHIYSATLFDVESREGEISSIISGYKTAPVGYKPPASARTTKAG
ncbi:MAG: Ni/Fe-hydrogenase, b-type cytochrome subunit [Vulcanimicrobiaceae bacterium]